MLNAKWAEAAKIVCGPNSEIARAYARHQARQQTYKLTLQALPVSEQKRLPGPDTEYRHRKSAMIKRGSWIDSWENMVKLAAAQQILEHLLGSQRTQMATAAMVHSVFLNSNGHMRKIVQQGIAARPELMLRIAQSTLAKYAGYKVTMSEIKGHRRSRPVNIIRREIFYRCKIETPFSLPSIGKYFGGKDHTSVLHSYRRYRIFQYADLGYITLTPQQWASCDRDRLIKLQPDEVDPLEIDCLGDWMR